MTEILRSTSPADPNDEIGVFGVADEAGVDEAVAFAAEAFPAWRDAGLDERAAVAKRFGEIAADRKDELTQLISREVGKARWDAAAEAGLLAPKVAVTLAEGMKLVSPVEVAPGQRATYRPRGVLAVYGPFNFPAHLPNGHIVPALVTGNTVVFKPSEVSPAVGQWMVDRWQEAGLPEGVLQIVHGAVDTGRALASHDAVDGILFTGSYPTGRAIQEATLDQPWKILALELGGSNPVIVCHDADLDLAVAETAVSIAVTTGQRCTCARRVFVDRRIEAAFTDKLVRVLSRIKIGHPDEEGVFMGPLASNGAHDRLVHYRALATEAGGTRLPIPSPALPSPWTGIGLVRFEDLRQHHPYQREEIFGPEAALYPVADLDDAIDAANDSDYGLAASVFTTARPKYERCVGRVRTGLLNWNKGTTGASGKLPFGGTGKSGNDRPAGVSATLYCTVVQSHLESEAGFDPETLPPGVPEP